MNFQRSVVPTLRIRNNLHPICLANLHLTSVRFNPKAHHSKNSCEEVKIPVPWGHISGKWWGRKDLTPVIGLHGYEDNAGTFDRLAPLLKMPAFLALDAPGHGRSSHIPRGMVYTFIDFIINLRRVKNFYGWERFSIIGHSFGSTMGHIYSSLYPSDIEKFVSLDCARTFMAEWGSRGVKGLPLLKMQSEKSLQSDKNYYSDPPAYSNDEIVKMLCKAGGYSVLEEHAQALLTRGMSVHPKKLNYFFFSRDERLRYSEFNRPNSDLLVASAQHIKCHVLSIVANKGFPRIYQNSDAGALFCKLEAIVQKSALSYAQHEIEGTHHVHLNNPERVAPLINDFFAC